MPLLAIAFGALVTLVFLTTWDNPRLKAMAFALIASYVLSNTAFAMQFKLDWIGFEERVTVFAMAELIVATTAFSLWRRGGPLVLVAVVIVATLSECGNVTILFTNQTLVQRHLWNAVCNVGFGLECLIVIGSGVVERARQAHRDRRPLHSRGLVARDDYR